MRKDKMDTVYYWISGMAAIFIMIVVYFTITAPIMTLAEFFTNATANLSTSSNVETLNDRVKMMWNLWPIVLGVGIILIIIMAAQKKEYHEEYSYGGGY